MLGYGNEKEKDIRDFLGVTYEELPQDIKDRIGIDPALAKRGQETAMKLHPLTALSLMKSYAMFVELLTSIPLEERISLCDTMLIQVEMHRQLSQNQIKIRDDRIAKQKTTEENKAKQIPIKVE